MTAANGSNKPPKMHPGQASVSFDVRTGDGEPAAAPPEAVRNAGNAAFAVLLKLEEDVRTVGDVRELHFLIANETRKLTRARQIFVFNVAGSGQVSVEAISSVASVDRRAPLVTWIEAVVGRLAAATDARQAKPFTLPEYCSATDEYADIYPFREMLWQPMTRRDGSLAGGILVAREGVWADQDQVVLRRLAGAFAHAKGALAAENQIALRFKPTRLQASLIAALAAALLLVPVPMTALAPAEIVATDPFIVAAAIDGVVESIPVESSQRVKKGDRLLRFADTALRNKHEIAEREVLVAEAKLNRSCRLCSRMPLAGTSSALRGPSSR